MPPRIAILGCGLVVSTMVRDLAADENYDVIAVDADAARLEQITTARRIQRRVADLSDQKEIRALADDADLICGALPSKLGFEAMQTIAASGTSFADISFMIEDARAANEAAQQSGATIVYDCGVAPGLANMCIGHAAATFDELEDVVYYVGGLPYARRWPYEYTAPFAPSDVIEEYVRPARMIENGTVVTKPALSEPELLDFDRIGTLEGFNTDGLRSLLDTVKATCMREKTLRYPGHCELMRVLRETGFFSDAPLQLRDQTVRPLELTSKLLFDQWRLLPGQRDFTVLRVVATGTRGSQRSTMTYELFDEADAESGEQSMARTTAYPCTIIARLIAETAFQQPGVHPPETLGRDEGVFRSVLEQLKQRGVQLTMSESKAE